MAVRDTRMPAVRTAVVLKHVQGSSFISLRAKGAAYGIRQGCAAGAGDIQCCGEPNHGALR